MEEIKEEFIEDTYIENIYIGNNLPEFDENGNEIFYPYNSKQYPGYCVTMSGKVKGPSGIILSNNTRAKGYIINRYSNRTFGRLNDYPETRLILLHIVVAKVFVYNPRPIFIQKLIILMVIYLTIMQLILNGQHIQ